MINIGLHLVAAFEARHGAGLVKVPSRRRLGVRTMVIDFGSVKGRISVD